MLLFDKKGMRIEKYWEPELKNPAFIDEKNTVEAVEVLLKDSVKIEMRSDVPVGAFLSGGVDSSCVVALASILTNGGFSTFHIEWPTTSEKINEKPFAQMVSDRYKTDHYVREISEGELISLLPKLVWHLEEPFADGAFVPTYALSRFASEKVKVVLSGAGGDELFGGYSHHAQVPYINAMLKKLIYGIDRNNSYYDKWIPLKKSTWSGIFEWYKPRVFKERIDAAYKKFKDIDELNATMLSDLLIYLQDDILFLTDKMTMAASLECRVPLLDHRLVELSLAVDSALKIKGKEKKYIFKKLMEKYLPKDVLYRKKEGFGAPVHTWVNKYKKRHFDKVLLSGIVSSSVASDSRRIKDLCKKETLEYAEAWEYWKIMLMELWFRIFIQGQPYDNIFS
jgi:asparagine synthase (glutamine-hydrolysing)